MSSDWVLQGLTLHTVLLWVSVVITIGRKQQLWKLGGVMIYGYGNVLLGVISLYILKVCSYYFCLCVCIYVSV